MQFHLQRNRHVPELGQIGDCFRTCIACFLNLDPEDVPNFVEIDFHNDDLKISPNMEAAYQAWLKDRGLTLIDIVFREDNLQAVLNSMAGLNGEDFCYMVGGKGQVHGHVAIYRGSMLLWDPAGGPGITGPLDGLFYVKILASLRCRYTGEE